METRNIIAEIFFSIPEHLWVLPAAFAVTFFGLKFAADSYFNGDKIKWVMYGVLVALAVIKSGFLAVFTPMPDMPDLLSSREPIPNYLGRFYLDAALTFAGWVAGVIGRSKF